MRISPLPYAVLALALAHLLGQQPPSATRNSEADVHLRATIQLISQSYCAALYKEIGNAGFKLHMKVLNEGGRPVILSKKYLGFNNPLVAYVRSDGTPGDAAYYMMLDDFGMVDQHYPKNLKRDYLVVQPSQAFEQDVATGAFFHNPSERLASKSVLEPGNYFLRVEFSLWDGPQDALAALRLRWNRVGDLFGGTINSNFIPVTIDPPQKLPNCGN